MSSLLLSPIDPASRTYCDQSWEVTEVIDEAGLSHGLAEDEASQSAMAWHESPSGGASLWQDCHKDGHGVTHGESVAGGGVTGCNIGSGDDTADRMGDDGSDSDIAAPSNLEEQWEALPLLRILIASKWRAVEPGAVVWKATHKMGGFES